MVGVIDDMGRLPGFTSPRSPGLLLKALMMSFIGTPVPFITTCEP